MSHQFEVIYEGDLRTLAKHLKSGSVIETDAPLDNHGKGERFSPTDLFTVSLASCMMTIMGIKAKEKKIDLSTTHIAIQKIMAENPRRVNGINIHFKFHQQLQLSEQDKTILERCAHTCPVKYSIHPDIVLNIAFNW